MQVASSQLGQSLVMAGQMDALQRMAQSLNRLALESAEPASDIARRMVEKLTQELQISTIPQIMQPLVRDLLRRIPSSDTQALIDAIRTRLEPSLIELAHQTKQLAERSGTHADSPETNDVTKDS